MQLQELKKAYDACRLSKENYHLLLQQRETIHNRIIQLKEEIAGALYKQKETQKELEMVADLKEKLQTIDHQIDELGEHQDEELAELKKKLVEEIHQSFPESTGAYQQLCEKLRHNRGNMQNCAALYENLHTFKAAMKEGAATKQTGGFFSFLFGRNAKVVLARAIRKASIEAERVYKNVDDADIQQFLKTFLEEANRPWNSKLYRDRFYELYHEFTLLMEKLEDRTNQSRRNVINTEKEIEIWIERYCRDRN